MRPARDTVLLLTHAGDYYTVDRIAEEVLRRGARALRLNAETFPTELELTSALDSDGDEVTLRTADGEVRGEQVRAVWLRRLLPPRLDAALEPSWREGCLRESQAALQGFLDGLEAAGCRFVNPFRADRAAQDKLHQLRRARALGLEVPRTLVTNDAARVRAFFEHVHGHMVAKMLTPLSQSMQGGQPFVYTSAIGPEDLEELEGLHHSPMVFQERLEKARELRVAVVGGQCFVGAIDASRSVAGQVDWRRSRPDECPWEPGELPAEVATRLVRLVAALGLVYGAADFIVTPEGRHVFLEVNPAGEWGMLEHDLDLPIAAAFAEVLTAESGSSPTRPPPPERSWLFSS
ncbi:MvdC family ATP-grasp ribosomal peptide maturase [Archangium violaceum]|uniref:MvdC/MvdD family ATP grasp protein n=1 Tax=Archangium violaceum TaxID=83451 RepID=UPI002B2FAAB1|nr:MvdC family ATP-grasp ribosomal peptide maturase [Archangium violaceum]